MPAVEAWFVGGPIDGRIMPVETGADGSLPQAVDLPQTGVYVGATDQASTVIHYRYVRKGTDGGPPTFRYAGQLP